MTRLEMARKIIDFEVRRDSAGHFRVYMLPANDGGGSFEVAGLNERYDPVEARHLRTLVLAERWEEAEAYAAEAIARKTDKAHSWTTNEAVEFFFRDCIFNRGVTGASKIIQMAAGVTVDGVIGPKSLAAIADLERRPLVFLARLRGARERYEREVVGYRENFWRGLINRFDGAFEVAAESLLA